MTWGNWFLGALGVYVLYVALLRPAGGLTGWLDRHQSAGFASEGVFGRPARWHHHAALFLVRLSPKVWWTVRRANQREGAHESQHYDGGENGL